MCDNLIQIVIRLTNNRIRMKIDYLGILHKIVYNMNNYLYITHTLLKERIADYPKCMR